MIKNKVMNKYISEIYIDYLTKEADDIKTLTDMLKELSDPAFL